MAELYVPYWPEARKGFVFLVCIFLSFRTSVFGCFLHSPINPDPSTLSPTPPGLATKLKEAGPAASDFLAAIELLVVDNADVIAMQNWSHLQTVLESLNQIPKKNTDVDVMRVRETHLEGFARHHRQTVFLSSFASAEINALSRVSCQNVAGRARYRVNSYPGVLGRAAAASGGARLRFDRVPDAGDETSDEKKNAVAEHDDARFKHFVKFALPRLRENPRAGSVVFVPSYFDFVKVRNLLTECEVSFAVASEYTPPRDAARARTIFADGRKRVLLVTERAHFYHRRKVKGVREVIFYGLPGAGLSHLPHSAYAIAHTALTLFC